jgi:hypothetical protein
VSDIVKRLRADIETWEDHYSDEVFVRYYPAPPLQQEAADEITRLRAEVEALRASRGELLEALRNLAHHAERANEIALREVGIGVCDINAIGAARAAIAKAEKEAGNA